MTLINDLNLIKQGIDFTGIENQKIHPTDIDALLEFDNRVLILMEVKYNGAKIPTGQRLVLERLCDNWDGAESIVLKVEHNHEDKKKPIILKDCFINKYYYKNKWRYSKKKNIYLTEVLKVLGNEFQCDKLKNL